MCKFASFVLTKDKEFWLSDTDSHEEIISRHGLRAEGRHGTNIVDASGCTALTRRPKL